MEQVQGICCEDASGSGRPVLLTYRLIDRLIVIGCPLRAGPHGCRGE